MVVDWGRVLGRAFSPLLFRDLYLGLRLGRYESRLWRLAICMGSHEQTRQDYLDEAQGLVAR
jgi:hypothetical protein